MQNGRQHRHAIHLPMWVFARFHAGRADLAIACSGKAIIPGCSEAGRLKPFNGQHVELSVTKLDLPVDRARFEWGSREAGSGPGWPGACVVVAPMWK